MNMRAIRNSRFGRLITRILGEEKVAVAVFGKTIVGMFDVAGKGASGQHTEAKSTLDKVQQEQAQGAQQASQYHDSMHK